MQCLFFCIRKRTKKNHTTVRSQRHVSVDECETATNSSSQHASAPLSKDVNWSLQDARAYCATLLFAFVEKHLDPISGNIRWFLRKVVFAFLFFSLSLHSFFADMINIGWLLGCLNQKQPVYLWMKLWYPRCLCEWKTRGDTHRLGTIRCIIWHWFVRRALESWGFWSIV